MRLPRNTDNVGTRRQPTYFRAESRLTTAWVRPEQRISDTPGRGHPDDRSVSGNPTVLHRPAANGNGMHPVTVHTARLHKASLRSPAAHSDRTPGPRNSQPNAEPFATPHIPGSYRLRRHFPRYCDVTTRVGHPYQPRILPTDIRPVRGIHPEDTACRTTGSHPPDDRTSSCKERETALRHPVLRSYYQLAFVTPGIRPFEAISRNWIRLMPNRRM